MTIGHAMTFKDVLNILGLRKGNLLSVITLRDLHLKNLFCIPKILHVKTRTQLRLGMLDNVELGREDEKIINIYCHYNKCPIVILDKDTVIGHAPSETQRLKLNANLFVPLSASLFEFVECMIKSPDKAVTSIRARRCLHVDLFTKITV